MDQGDFQDGGVYFKVRLWNVGETRPDLSKVKVRLWLLMHDQKLIQLPVDISLISKHILNHNNYIIGKLRSRDIH